MTTFLAMAAVADGARAGDDDPATSNLMSGGVTIPYEGFLMLDNAPMTGTQLIRFELWDDPSASAATNLRYSETQTVTLYNGSFAVVIVAGTQIGTRTLDEAVLDGDRLYIAMAIQDAGGAFVPLVGRQAIEAVPYSAWSQNASNMSIAGDLTVSGSIQGPVQVSGQLTTTGAVVADQLGVVNNAVINGYLDVFGNQATIDRVHIGRWNAGGRISSRVQSSPLYLTGGASNDVVEVTGDVSAPNNTWSGSCTLTTVRQLTHPTTNLRQCPDGTYVAGINFSFANSPPAVTDIQYVLTCCPI